jgi:enterobactin synthetase component D
MPDRADRIPTRATTDRFAGEIVRALRQLSPAGVFFAAIRIGEVEDLMGPELELVARARPARRHEFAAGRWCARQALQMAGGPCVAIPQGRRLAPIWPAGFGGSLTHDGRFAAAAAYRLALDAPQVGIDLVDRPDPVRFRSVARTILSTDERLGVLRGDPLELATIFSAKEAAIKILSSHVGKFIEFGEIASQQVSGGYVLTHAAAACRVHSRSCLVDDVLVTVALSCSRDGGTAPEMSSSAHSG